MDRPPIRRFHYNDRAGRRTRWALDLHHSRLLLSQQGSTPRAGAAILPAAHADAETDQPYTRQEHDNGAYNGEG